MKALETIKAKEVEVSDVCQRYGVAHYNKASGWQSMPAIHVTPESALEDFNRMCDLFKSYQEDEFRTFTHYTIFELTLQNPLFL